MGVSTYLPFQTTYYLNGHHFIEIELRRQGVAFRKDDNAFLSTEDPKALQATADKLSAAIIEKRLNYWSWLLCPKFSEKDRKAVDLHRDYSINQVEYCRNFIFKRHFLIHKIFEQSCEMGLFRLAADKGSTSSGCVSPNGSVASCIACWKNSPTATRSCASTARTSWAACTKSSAPSCGWKYASTG